MPVSCSNDRYRSSQRCHSLAWSRRCSDRAASERSMPPTISPPIPSAVFRPECLDRCPRDPRCRPRYSAFSASRELWAASPLRCVTVRPGWALAGATVRPNAAQHSAVPKSRDACLFIAFILLANVAVGSGAAPIDGEGGRVPARTVREGWSGGCSHRRT
jgi:hypothetical protein